jgi:hypothetical protein
MADPVVGSILGGKYLVEGILGQGGMGIVVAARHIELDQRVAIKCLLAHAQTVPEIVERFTREARAAAKIHGEHVARVIDVGRFEDGSPFMVMEHLRGRDLADELGKNGPLPVADAVRYLLETCEALVQAHALRIVHRDLKPSNLFLAEQPGRRPIVKVLDFGISKVIGLQAGALTKTASVMGTPYYMSPEQLLSSKSVDERSDIWALGVILYELLVGRPPFVAETAPEVVAQVLQNAPVPVTSLRPDVPPGLEVVIDRCMRSKVGERFANVAELAHALVPFAAPEDQDSALAIARVLGMTGPPASTVPVASAHAPTLAIAQSKPPPQGPPAALPAPAGTAHNLTYSASETGAAARKPWGVVAATGVVLVLAVVGGVAGVRTLRQPAAAPTPAQGGSAQPSVSPAGALLPPAAVALAPVDRPSPSASTALQGVATGGAPPPIPGAHLPPKHATAAAPPPPPASPASAARPAPAQPPPPSPAQPVVAPPANPLDMHIK